jgi:hypothetical protein
MTHEQKVFAWLVEHQPASLSQIVAAFPFLDPESVRQVVSRLRKKGHVELVPPPKPTYSVAPGARRPPDYPPPRRR